MLNECVNEAHAQPVALQLKLNEERRRGERRGTNNTLTK